MKDPSMITIWQAQGVLMEQQNVSADRAMELLRCDARRAGCTVGEEAQRVLSDRDAPGSMSSSESGSP